MDGTGGSQPVGGHPDPQQLAWPVEKAAKMLGLSPSQLRTLLRAKVLRGVQLVVPGATRGKWLVPVQEIERVLRNSS